MKSAESVTTWIEQLKSGDPRAAQLLWQRYLDRLIRLARHALANVPRSVADEDDVVTVAFTTFLQNVDQGRFPRLDDRDDLWKILVTLTERAAIDQMRTLGAQRRDGRRTSNEASLNVRLAGDAVESLEDMPALEPSPEMACIAVESLQRLLDALGDDELRRIATLKMQGFSDPDIKAKLGISLRSVQRKLRLIRTIWSREVDR